MFQIAEASSDAAACGMIRENENFIFQRLDDLGLLARIEPTIRHQEDPRRIAERWSWEVALNLFQCIEMSAIGILVLIRPNSSGREDLSVSFRNLASLPGVHVPRSEFTLVFNCG